MERKGVRSEATLPFFPSSGHSRFMDTRRQSVIRLPFRIPYRISVPPSSPHAFRHHHAGIRNSQGSNGTYRLFCRPVQGFCPGFLVLKSVSIRSFHVAPTGMFIRIVHIASLTES